MVGIEGVGVAAGEHDAQQRGAHVDGHRLQLARLHVDALVVVEAEGCLGASRPCRAPSGTPAYSSTLGGNLRWVAGPVIAAPLTSGQEARSLRLGGTLAPQQTE